MPISLRQLIIYQFAYVIYTWLLFAVPAANKNKTVASFHVNC